MKPRALDTFCGAGGVTVGLQRAGFHVTGVDNRPQPRYPGECFRIADALKYIEQHGREYDFIWASPPCQAYSIASLSRRNAGKKYPDLLAPARERLKSCGIPYVIENVPGAPMRADLILCGSLFGLRLIRHRWFEMGFDGFALVSPCQHHPIPLTVTGGGTPSWSRRKNGGKCFSVKENREAMGINWMYRYELSEAIPPAYSEFIGRQFLGSHGLN